MSNRFETGLNPNTIYTFQTLARLASVGMLWLSLGCGPSGIEASSNSNSTSKDPQVEQCVTAQFGDTITGILDQNHLPATTDVRVLASDHKTEIYHGEGVNGPILQDNPPITNDVCFPVQK